MLISELLCELDADDEPLEEEDEALDDDGLSVSLETGLSLWLLLWLAEPLLAGC